MNAAKREASSHGTKSFNVQEAQKLLAELLDPAPCRWRSDRRRESGHPPDQDF